MYMTSLEGVVLEEMSKESIILTKSDFNSKIKWMHPDRFWAPDGRLYLQLFDITPINIPETLLFNF